MMIIVDDLTGETVGWLFTGPGPAPETFSGIPEDDDEDYGDPAEMAKIAATIEFGRFPELSEIDKWERELTAWLDSELDPADPLRDELWPELTS